MGWWRGWEEVASSRNMNVMLSDNIHIFGTTWGRRSHAARTKNAPTLRSYLAAREGAYPSHPPLLSPLPFYITNYTLNSNLTLLVRISGTTSALSRALITKPHEKRKPKTKRITMGVSWVLLVGLGESSAEYADELASSLHLWL